MYSSLPMIGSPEYRAAAAASSRVGRILDDKLQEPTDDVIDFVVRTAFVCVFVRVTVAPETNRPPGSVMVPRMVDVPVWLQDKDAARIRERRATFRRLRIGFLQ